MCEMLPTTLIKLKIYAAIIPHYMIILVGIQAQKPVLYYIF